MPAPLQILIQLFSANARPSVVGVPCVICSGTLCLLSVCDREKKLRIHIGEAEDLWKDPGKWTWKQDPTFIAFSLYTSLLI